MVDPLFLAERRRFILDQLQQSGRVSVRALSDELGVSTVTIRQDLRALEKEGLIERTYGGAILVEKRSGISELSFHVRQVERHMEKDAIARAAAALVQNGYGVALDASTSTFAMTPYLKSLEGLTIVTNSLMIAQQFLDTPHVEVNVLGGRLRRDSVSLVGRPDREPGVNLNIGFFGVRGLTLAEGATDVSLGEVEMKRAALQRCHKTVVVADSSKWGQIAPYSFAPINRIDLIITSDRTPAETLRTFREAGVEVQAAVVT